MGKPLHRRVLPETYIQLLYEYLEARGFTAESMLGMPWPTPAPSGLGGVNVVDWQAMLERAEQHLGDPLLGLHLGQAVNARHLGILGSVFLACENLAQALLRMERFQRLIFDVAPMSHRVSANWIDLVWDISEFKTGRLVDETGFAVMVQFCRSLVRSSVHPLLVEFAHSPATQVQAYEDFFQCPVLFDRPEPLIRFDIAHLALPLKGPDAGLIQVLEQHAERLLAQLPQQGEISGSVRRVIAGLMREGEPSIENVSAVLCCSSRTLQRRLSDSGTNFRAELNLVRHQVACDYLNDPRLQIADVALLLGYSEHSAFTRAFREWAGETPQQYRERG